MSAFGTFLLAFITAVVAATGTVYAIERYHLLEPHDQPEQVTVPSLMGLDDADARTNLRAVGLLYLAAPREASSASKPGTVIRQSVSPGQQLPKNHPVTVTLAEELPKVPSVTGLAQAEAQSRLEQAGYTVEIAPAVPNESVKEGLVVTQAPAADSAAAKGAKITLTPSAGAAAIEVPKVTGQNVNTAQRALEKLGFAVDVRWSSVAETATYIVLAQSPKPGTMLRPGEKVELSANR